ncbi:MAG: hypothetical protein ACOZJX_03535 [Pseudomonadota bacterium]
MRHRSLPRLRWPHFFVWPAWPPLLVLGLSVMASVTLIGACMAMLSPEAEAGGRWATPEPGAATPAATQLPPSASRNTRVRSASAG